jgi:drug/metabolite transporter (DMT)-like permease
MSVNSNYSAPLSQQLRGTLLVILSGTLFGLIGILGSKLFDLNFTVENMLFWRFFIATLWILLVCVVLRKNVLQKKTNDRSILKTFVFAALSYSAGSAFYFMASKQIGTGVAMVIFYSFPVFVALFTWVLNGWQINKHAAISVMAVVIGLLFLKGDGGEHELDVIGIAFGIIAALSYAAYVYGSQHSAKKIDALLLTLMVCFGNTLIFLALSLYTKSFVVPTSWEAWFYICAIGIVATVLPIQLLLTGLKYISPIKASIISVSEPIVTVLIGLILLNESMSYSQSFGIIVILLGAICIQFERAPTIEMPAPEQNGE